MEKLTKIKVKDLLSHEDTTATIAPCVTVFTGRSDSGKSVLMRALLWACENRPSGINLLRHGAKRGAYAEAELTGVDDNGVDFSVTRRRSKSSNEYVLNETELKAFGTETPDCIKRVLNLSNNWVRSQEDSEFLLSESDGEVARVLGQTVGLSQIDKAFSNVRERKSVNDADLRSAKSDVERETTELAQFDKLDVANAALLVVEEQEQVFSEFTNKVNQATVYLQDIGSIPPTVKIEGVKEELKNVETLSSIVATKNLSCQQGDDLVRNLSSLPNEVDVKRVKSLLGKVDQLNTTVLSLVKKQSNVEHYLSELLDTPDNVDSVECWTGLTNIKVDLDKKEKIESVKVAVEQSIKELVSIPPDVNTVDVKEQLSIVKHYTKTAVDINKQIVLLYDRTESLNGCTKESTAIIAMRKNAKSQIDEYLQLNPTCRECGAKQENWINK